MIEKCDCLANWVRRVIREVGQREEEFFTDYRVDPLCVVDQMGRDYSWGILLLVYLSPSACHLVLVLTLFELPHLRYFCWQHRVILDLTLVHVLPNGPEVGE